MSSDMFDATKKRAQLAATHHSPTVNPHALETTQRAIAARDQHVGGANPQRQAVGAIQKAAVSAAQFTARTDASAAAVSAGGFHAFDGGHQTALLQAKTSMGNEFLAAQKALLASAPQAMLDQMKNVKRAKAGLSPMPVKPGLEDID